MAEYVVESAFSYFGALDLSPWANQWSMVGSFDTLDKTTFRNTGARRFKGGLFTTNYSVSGIADVTDADPALWTGFTGRTVDTVIAGNIEAEGQPCVFMQVVKSSLAPHGGSIGQLATFDAQATSTDKFGGVRGVLLVEQASVSTTGAKGTAVQHGAVSASQNLFAAFNLMGTAGTSITAVLESDDNSGFSSATTRVTFGPLTAVGGNFATPVAGAITDDWWRIRVTAITGTWVMAAAMAIR